jgi:hypothetical protein
VRGLFSLGSLATVAAVTLGSTDCSHGASQADAKDSRFRGSVAPISHEPSSPGSMPSTLATVRTGLREDGSVRVVFEFREPTLPGYTIEYAREEPTACGSGERVKVAGTAHLLVRLSPAQAHEARGEEQVATAEPRDRRVALGPVQQLTLICDFEGVVQWVLGVKEPHPYRAFTLTEPSRLVVDVSGEAIGRVER